MDEEVIVRAQGAGGESPRAGAVTGVTMSEVTKLMAMAGSLGPNEGSFETRLRRAGNNGEATASSWETVLSPSYPALPDPTQAFFIP